MDRSPSPVPLIATGSGKPEMATSLIYSASHPLDPQIMRLSGDGRVSPLRDDAWA